MIHNLLSDTTFIQINKREYKDLYNHTFKTMSGIDFHVSLPSYLSQFRSKTFLKHKF